MRKLTEEEVIERFKEVHGDKYDYSLVKYSGTYNKVKIICKEHGVFEQIPKSHFNGWGCAHCAKCGLLNTDMFIDRCNIIYENKYDYSLVNYINSKTKVKIICPIHGIFNQSPSKHMSGKSCYKCGRISFSKKKTKIEKDILQIFNDVHGIRYDYSKFKYKGTSIKSTIICSIHGEFEQSPSNHKKGHGCSKCGDYEVSVKNGLTAPGWTPIKWGNSAKLSKNFDSFKVYIIKCYKDNELFYKIGRTYLKIEKRFTSNKVMPYNYEILHEFIFNTAKEAFDKETELKRLHKEYKYIPKIKFGGMYECFSEINI